MTTNDVLDKASSVVMCADGTLSCAGGRQGACSHHGGIADAVRAAAPSPPAVTVVRVPARLVRVRTPAPSTRNLGIALGVGFVALVAANEYKAWRDAKQQPE